MPIHDQGYRHYEGTRMHPGGVWWIIARTHMRDAFRYRWFLVLMLAGWLQFLARVAQIYLSTAFQQAAFLETTARTFRDFFDIQSTFVFFIAIAMSGLIADDRRANALQLYLSRPLTRTEYIVGKAIPPVVFVLSVTFAPALALLVMRIIFAGSVAFLRDNLFLLPAITLYSVVQALLVSCAVLALSSLSKSRRFVAIMYAGIVFFTAAMSRVLSGITGSQVWAVIAPGQMLDVVANAAFRVSVDPPVPVPVAVVVVALLIVASVWILERRVRAVEIVG